MSDHEPPQPYSPDELTLARQRVAETDGTLIQFSHGVVARLLATIDARDAEIARLKEEQMCAIAAMEERFMRATDPVLRQNDRYRTALEKIASGDHD